MAKKLDRPESVQVTITLDGDPLTLILDEQLKKKQEGRVIGKEAIIKRYLREAYAAKQRAK